MGLGGFPARRLDKGQQRGKGKWDQILTNCWLKLYSGFPTKWVFTIYVGFNTEHGAKIQWWFLAANLKFWIYCSISPKLDNHLVLSETLNKIQNCESFHVIVNLTKTCPPHLLCRGLAGLSFPLAQSGPCGQELWAEEVGNDQQNPAQTQHQRS